STFTHHDPPLGHLNDESPRLGISKVLSRHRRTLQIVGGSVLITIGLLLVSGVWEQWMALLQVRVGNFTTIV
ncbi:hypothetical protein ACFFHZ_08145, partial [Brachybacterium muris]